ncbi:heme-degrading monooxygenase HmoA [Microbacterium phyllosphaerae]|uniref:Heme-degrading monooxygenase HmoA n=1 Tax=Microbacterium phyllosphaerae TaxID=124798 RepID=A0ABS4WLB8_9MICO|nr:antibiotic biosynthesis monooxygenase [Microbacterium phyllosphaerae]MBP2376981.1 heme-degrading monooxygenase HmoA [Microbacterium phyllosphaerae]
MILEVADIRAPEGASAEFEAAIRLGLENVLSTADGFVSYRLLAGLESPDRYLLLITWQTIEHHTIGFRNSSLYDDWSSIVRPQFASAPQVEHFTAVLDSGSEAGAPAPES